MPSTEAPLTEELKFFNEANLLDSYRDYFKTLIYFEQTDATLDEKYISNTLGPECECLQTIHVLHGQRRLLVSSKSKDSDRIETNIIGLLKDKYPDLKRAYIPFTNSQVVPILLLAEIKECQLHLLSGDKLTAARFIEARTGLQHVKQLKQSVYFTGLLFQFLMLNEMLGESGKKLVVLNEISQNVVVGKEVVVENGAGDLKKSEELVIDSKIVNENKTKMPSSNWRSLYDESEVKGHFRIRPKHQNEGENSLPDLYYEIYIFVADLTDLNTDGLVNATNPSLHPGYVGDGIARRIRAKAGKQMQDACKRIIRQEHNSEPIQEGEVILTKSSGKLKSKYVLHAVAPTWTKHIINNTQTHHNHLPITSPTSSVSSMTSSSMTSSPTSSTSSTSTINMSDKFEYLMEKTLTNILELAHDPKLQLTSLALPMSSDGDQGGAFDMPIELFAHSVYTQLCEFRIEKGTSLRTFCISSLEADTIASLCEMFTNYTDSYSESSWAMPLSPINRLISVAMQNKTVVVEPEQVNESEEIKVSENSHLVVKTTNSIHTSDQHIQATEQPTDKPITSSDYNTDHTETASQHSSIENLRFDKLTVTIQIKDDNNINTSRLITTNPEETANTLPRSFDEKALINIKNNRRNQQRTVSTSSTHSNESGTFDKARLNFSTRTSESSNTSSTSTSTTSCPLNYFKSLDVNIRCDSSCLFCQRENKTQLVACGNETCKGIFCHTCIINYFKNNHKCPSCRQSVEREVINNLRDRYSSSPEPVKLMSIQNTGMHVGSRNRFGNGNGNNSGGGGGSSHSISSSGSGKSTNNSNEVKNAIVNAKVHVRILDECCDGYEKLKTIMIIFDIEDGIQSDNHPRPGLAYKGTTKKVYLPEIPEHREILAFYEKALHAGKLFKIAFSRQYDDFRVLLNQDVLLKTSQHGGGRFGYPDYSYVKDILYTARK